MMRIINETSTPDGIALPNMQSTIQYIFFIICLIVLITSILLIFFGIIELKITKNNKINKTNRK